MTAAYSAKQYEVTKTGSYLMRFFVWLLGVGWALGYVCVARHSTGKQNLCSIIRLSFISTFVSIFLTVPSALDAFKYPVVLYDDLNEIGKQVFTA